MKVCPKCTSISLRKSHTRSAYERFLQSQLDYRFFRCQQCDWRGKGKVKKKVAKLKWWQTLAIYAAAIAILLFILFGVIGVGDVTPPPPPQ